MLALSIQQPWAWAICNLGKDIENRSWPTKVRGQFLIHTGKKVNKDGYDYISTILKYGLPPISELKTGGIVGIAEITGCVRSHDSEWFFGPYGFVLKNQKPLAFVPYKGRLGFFDVDYPNCVECGKPMAVMSGSGGFGGKICIHCDDGKEIK